MEEPRGCMRSLELQTRAAPPPSRDEEPTSHLSSSSSSSSLSPSSSGTSCLRPAVRTSPQHRQNRSSSPRYTGDDRLLRRALADAGWGAYGIALVELWAINEAGTHLFRPEGGWWTDPVAHRHEGSSSTCSLCRLVDPHRQDYVAPRQLSPGEGLPGALWSKVSPHTGGTHSSTTPPTTHWSRSFRETLAHRILHHPPPSSPPAHPAPVSTAAAATPPATNAHDYALHQVLFHYLHQPSTAPSSSGIAWEHLGQLKSDPDQPWNPRLQLLAGAGLGWVAGVPYVFHSHDAGGSGGTGGAQQRGLVLYAARAGADRARLRSPSHESYLAAATNLVAAAYAMMGPRRAMAQDGASERARAWRQVRRRILILHREGGTLRTLLDQREKANASNAAPVDVSSTSGSALSFSTAANPESSHAAAVRFLEDRLTTALTKCRGGGAPIPPALSWRQSLFTFLGCFITLGIITSVSDELTQRWGPDHAIILGPFGALMTLLYGLTAAPASQPRNAVVGQVFSVLLALAVSRATAWPLPVRQSLATALSIAAMVKCGVTHPPAGASALLVASGTYGWSNVAWTLLGNLVAVVVATMINNLSHQRQYPMYWWGFEGFLRPAKQRNDCVRSPTTTAAGRLRHRTSQNKWTYDEEISV